MFEVSFVDCTILIKIFGQFWPNLYCTGRFLSYYIKVTLYTVTNYASKYDSIVLHYIYLNDYRLTWIKLVQSGHEKTIISVILICVFSVHIIKTNWSLVYCITEYFFTAKANVWWFFFFIIIKNVSFAISQIKQNFSDGI